MNFSLVQHLKVGPEHRLQSWKRLTPISVKCATEWVGRDSRSIWKFAGGGTVTVKLVWSDGAVRARIEDSAHRPCRIHPSACYRGRVVGTVQ